MIVTRTNYKILVEGLDITSVISPLLINLTVKLNAGSVSDSASFELDDSYARLKLPRDDAAVVIYLGTVPGMSTEVFRGKVNDIKSNGGRTNGRTITIGCTGMDTKGKSKEPRLKHFDNKSVKDILTDAANYAGITHVNIDQELGATVLEYFLQNNESLVHLGHRLSVLLGGTFKIQGDQAVMVKRNAGRSASGKPLLSVIASYGDNLVDWSMTPIIGRPRLKSAQVKWYDQQEAKWQTASAKTQDSKATVTGTARYAVGSKTEAQSRANADSAEADRTRGGGTITINGNAAAQPEATVSLIGARPGVDGTYTIDSLTHTITRAAGFTTALTVKKPADQAGIDNR